MSEAAPVLAASQSNPAMQRFFNPMPAYLTGESSLSISNTYSSIYLQSIAANGQQYLADLELYQLDLRYMKRWGKRSVWLLHIPVFRANAGVLDGFLRQYHQALNLPNGGRENRPDNAYAYQYNGLLGAWKGHSGWGLGNIQAQWRYELAALAGIQISTGLGLKIPTASVSQGWSNGGVDAAWGVMAAWQHNRWASHAETWWTHPLKRQDFGHAIADYMRASLSVAYAADTPWHVTWIGQVQGGTSPYRTGLAAMDKAPWLVSGGVEIKAQEGRVWQLTLIENITQESTQDFGINVEVSLPL